MTRKLKYNGDPPHRFVERMKLHDKQQEVWDAYFSGRYRALVINAGRRFGKSTVCMAIAIEIAVNYGKKVWWVGKTYRDSGSQWRNAKQLLKGVYTSKNEVDRRLEFFYDLPDGTKMRGEITFRSADTPDNLRGEGLDLLILDEAAFQSEEVYTVLRPSLADRGGDIIFISTPNGHNWFFTFFMRGQKENQANFPKWWSKHYTSYDNSAIPNIREEIDSARDDMTETEFRIEHMAEFLDDIGKVFVNVRSQAVLEMQDIPRVHGLYSMGIDLARKHDSTVVSVLNMNTVEQVYGIRFTNEDWDMQKAKLIALIKAWKPFVVYADATGVGQEIVEDLQKQIPTTHIEPFILTSASKPPLIQKLAIMLQNKVLKIIDDKDPFGKIQANELLAYEAIKSKDGMKTIYSAPRGQRDDTVIALALSLLAISGKAKMVLSASNPFFPEKKVQDPIDRSTILSKYAQKAREIQQQYLADMGET